MKCPHCVRDNLKSILTTKKGVPISGEVNRFWDEEGNLHVHDETIYVDVFSCSNDHHWMTEQKSRCPCQIGCAWNEIRVITAPPT